MTGEQFKQLEDNVKVEQAAYEIYLPISDDLTKQHAIEIIGYCGDYFDLTNYKLNEGREPNQNNEIAIEKSMTLRHGLSVGDTFQLPVKNDELKEFEIVGIVDVVNDGYYHNQKVFFTKQAIYNMENDFISRTFFTVTDGFSVKEVGGNIKTDLNLENLSYNHNLLFYLGQPLDEMDIAAYVSLATVVLFLSIIVCLATIAVIYNSFNISFLERVKQIGIIRSIGCTPKQTSQIFFIEAAIQCFIAIPFGTFAGIGAMHVVFYILSQGSYSSFANFTVTISPLVITISSIMVILSVLISAFIPLIKTRKKQPIEAIFYQSSLKRPRYKKGKGSILSKIFAWEIILAFKNLQRNKRRFITTAFSLGISVILFIVFSIFAQYTFSTASERASYENNDFELLCFEQLYSLEDYQKIQDLSNVKSIYPLMETDVSINMEKSNTGEFLEASFRGYNKKAIKKSQDYLVQGKIDVDKNDGAMLVKTGRETEKLDYSVGDKISFCIKEEDKDVELEIVGILEFPPLSQNYRGETRPIIITAKETYTQITGIDEYNGFYVNAVEDIDFESHINLSENLSEIVQKNSGEFRDALADIRRGQQTKIETFVFIYGFVALISVIAVLNIITTISTNLLTRTKEFAMLRAVGLSPQTLCNMVRFEAIFTGLIGVTYGLIIGNILGYWLYNIMIDIHQAPWNFPWRANMIVIIAVILVSLMASYTTISKVKKMNIIDEIRMED
ncbi:FtsX-like permease family protein [Proteinivorax tanatarense]|uniref:FtsX-like permease family protein n=1 Tax=Proteinivorax tanatarense TaxID=1260629 RepID=A0AAU7VKN1_9FIRM